MKKIILTGDRPTGKLHLGHYVGSLKNRLKLQDENEVYILVADLHALTTNQHTEEMKNNIQDLVIDQLSVGIDPKKVNFCVQSRIPEGQELFTILSMLVGISRLERIPTYKEVKRDLKLKHPTLGFFSYPVIQAADILMVRANLVPIGRDQKSHLELTREIAKEFNRTWKLKGDKEVFILPESLIPKDVGVLPGIDGKAKMSKSLNNAIFLSDDSKTVEEKVNKMYTDPTRIHATDPGKVEGNPVFIYLDAFASDNGVKQVATYKESYKKGEVGDVEIKKFLVRVLNDFLDPIRSERDKFEERDGLVDEILEEGSKKARIKAQATLKTVKEAMGLY